MLKSLASGLKSLSGWKRWLTGFFAGALAALAQPPFDFSLVCFIAFPVLVWLVDATQRLDGWRAYRSAAAIGWWFGFGYFVAGLWWIGGALLVDAEAFAWALPLAVLGLPAFLAGFYAFAVFFARLFWSQGLGRVLALAAGFLLAEWLRSFLFTGFPWNAIGYAAIPVPLLMQVVDVVGLTGMSGLAVLVFAAPVLLTGGRLARTGLTLAVLLMAAQAGYGVWRLQEAGPVANSASDAHVVRIVQASIPQNLKWDNAQRREIFEKHLELTQRLPVSGAGTPQIIVWPETSVPYLLEETPQALERVAESLQKGQRLMAGAVRKESGVNESGAMGVAPLYYNSIMGIDETGKIFAHADKLHLVPFGEYLPFEGLLRKLGVQEIVEMPGGFTAASERISLDAGQGISFLPLICYEAIFPDELSYTGPRAQAILNVTNDGWYGNTPGPYQHFRQAQIRAVEQRLPLVRAANNGLSAVVDAYGRIVSGLSLNEIGVVDARLPVAAVPFWGTSPGRLPVFCIFIALLTGAVVLRLVSFTSKD